MNRVVIDVNSIRVEVDLRECVRHIDPYHGLTFLEDT